ncbi:MAG TPA: MFS transporter [Gemmatimonadaceae bacterium]|nr:MFS transporter [Gemmatimonadaceae bacterium]HPV73864.1 MFS transporter [Gemmatimonadaceae bacterium]
MIERRAYRRVTWRLIPFLFACYVAAYLDRVNVGFAKLQMLADLQMSETAYGIGAGIFFIGYFLFEVPSNLILHRTGARAWIARIMVTWGLLSAATMWVTSATAFYALRFLLGIAEAGFFPGIVLYLTQWYPAPRRARIMALFMTAIAISGVIGGPVSGWILSEMAGKNGWAGWQWLYLLEGIPAVLLGVATYFYLDDSIEGARWLPDDEKAVLRAQLRADPAGEEHVSVMATLRDSRVVLLAALYFCSILGLYGLAFWLPQLIRTLGVAEPWRVGMLSAIPYGVATVAMVLAGQSSDRRGERRWHLVGSALIGALGLVGAAWFRTEPVAGMIAFSVAAAGILSLPPLFWTIPTTLLRGVSAAAGIAAINSVGNLSGFVSPYMIGAITDATGEATIGLYVLAASLVASAGLSIAATAPPTRR